MPPGPRDSAWRATEPATLVWAEALDGGDWNVKVPARDKMHAAEGAVRRAGRRDRAHRAALRRLRVERAARRRAVARVRREPPLDDAPSSSTSTIRKAKPRLLWDLVQRRALRTTRAIRCNASSPTGPGWCARTATRSICPGTGSSPDGDRPFLDRLDLKTLKSERLFRSDKTAYERFLAFTGPERRRSVSHLAPVADRRRRTRSCARSATASHAPAGEARSHRRRVAVTHIPDPTPAVRAIKKRLVKYKRDDGARPVVHALHAARLRGRHARSDHPLRLSARLRRPVEGRPGHRLAADVHAPVRIQLLLLAGYAIIDNASFPIVGDPKKAYDTYLEQLVADAKAAVDEAVRLGVADPDRIGVTGHSHGALMTANLSRTPNLFRAGVATSGSYNKTLTPFGFQNERRSVWEAPDVYLKVSPFFFADKLKPPLLIMHGAEDANPGTTPLQAQKLYEAIRGNGGTARLVMLPHEPHWYRDGVERAADLRDAALVRQVCEKRAAAVKIRPGGFLKVKAGLPQGTNRPRGGGVSSLWQKRSGQKATAIFELDRFIKQV